MTASIQMRSDFIYPVSGQLGELIFEIKGAEDMAFLPEIIPVAPGLYLSIMTGPANDYPRIDFRVGNAPVTFCLTLSGRFSSIFSSPGGFKEKNQHIGPNTNTIGSLKGAWGRMVVDPSLPVTCVELLIDPRLLHSYLPDHLIADVGGEKQIRLFRGQEFLSYPLDPELRKTALEVLNPPPLMGAALELFYQSRAMILLSRQVELFCQNARKAAGPPLKSEIRDQLAHAKSILTTDFLDPPTIPVLARRCGLNEFTLKKEFKRTFNTTIFTFVQKLKMEQAWALIREKNHSVSEAANAVGYINVSHFSKAFKKQFSINPGILKKDGNPDCPAHGCNFKI
ncbi:helix-turn-helix transcriptional regulator [Desulfobacter curvatus]|uniref:helix-turn-helix transcriptional regulator n=1 Tax=Desulfobacter curvatus TaxID=2290 RepID=UPI000367F8EA|nr:AraC family transcriptional regulator [Desulfobacter curvatus]